MTPSGRCTARNTGDGKDRGKEAERLIVMEREADGGMLMSASAEEVEVGTKAFVPWGEFILSYGPKASR